MKKVLVTGAGGSIGINVIKYLLIEGKYEITVLDIKNKRTQDNLKKYKNRVNIIYGEVNDNILMEALVKDHDYIIHLAGIMPPLADFNFKVAELVDYNGTENIIKAINKYNSNCFLIYASTTNMYDSSLSASVKEKINVSDISNYSLNKFNTENLIRKKLKNYCILRLPLILNNFNNEPFMLNIKKNSIVEVSTNYDASYAFVKALDYKDELNKKIFNVGMGSKGIIKYDEILKKILINYGISFKYILSRIFLEHNYKSPVLTDSDDLDDIIHYRTDSLYNYFNRLKRRGKKRRIQKLLAKPLIWLKNKE